MIEAIGAGFFSFVLFIVVHVMVFRSFELKERFRAITVIFIAVIPLYVLLYSLIAPDYMVVSVGTGGPGIIAPSTALSASRHLAFLIGLALYVFLFLGYCQFYFIVDRSISVRVMIEILESDKKRLTQKEIKDAYSLDGLLDRRLGHMIEGDYIKGDSAEYSNTWKGAFEARFFKAVKRLLRLGKGG
ncbi:MAG: hypothetical protein AABZ23_06365 [Deltaproteobacteria bacterium]